MKKLVALVLALAMITLCAVASAATITINPPANTDAEAQNTYNIYKIFDAVVNTADNTKVSYKLPSGITTPPTGFSVDTAGNVTYTGSATDGKLTTNDIDAIKAYITTNNIQAVATKTVTGTNPAEFGDLAAGYYYIDTTTGTLVTVETNNDTLNLTDKNTVPELDKEITGASGTIDTAGENAISQVGTNVQYTVQITVGKGMKDYKLHDTMGNGLSFNNDLAFSYNPAAPEGYTAPIVRTATTDPAADNGDTFTVDFADGLPENTLITVTYSAKVTNEALTYIPEKNTAKVEYGNGPHHGFTPPEETNTYSAKIGVNKLDGTNNDQPLPGAGFKLYKFDTDGTTKLYYSYDATNKTVTWAATTTDERITAADGTISPFLGLNDGTYYLEESTVPAGYNAPTSDTQVIIAGNDYSQANLEQTKTIRNNQGSVLPSTGGIGTTIFYAVGGLMVLGAAIIMVSRRKAEAR